MEMLKTVLSTGEVYIPVKENPPEYPCIKCKNKCDDICARYMDYEKMTCVYRITVFD